MINKMLEIAKETVRNNYPNNEILGIFLYGSQNYGMDTEESDYDFKAILLPSLEEIIEGSKKISTSIEYEGGLIEVKDIRAYKDTLLKMNPAYIEILYTDYFWINEDLKDEWNKMIDIRDRFVNGGKLNHIRAILGMCYEKRKALTHPYPTIKHKIDKYGIDPKQLHHIARLHYMFASYYKYGKSYKESLNISNDFDGTLFKENIMELKIFDKYNKTIDENIVFAKNMSDSLIGNIEDYMRKNEYSMYLDVTSFDEIRNIVNEIVKLSIIKSISKGTA